MLKYWKYIVPIFLFTISLAGFWHYSWINSDIHICEDHIKWSMKDPYSIKYEGYKSSQTSSGDTLIQEDFYAKNSYGAYGKDTYYCYIKNKNIINTILLSDMKRKEDDLAQKSADEYNTMILERKITKEQVLQTIDKIIKDNPDGDHSYMQNIKSRIH